MWLWYLYLFVPGYGNFNKVIYEFDKVFWDKDIRFFGIAEDNYNNTGRETAWLNMYYFIKRPVLIAFLQGTYADYSEVQMNDAQIKAWGKYICKRKWPYIWLGTSNHSEYSNGANIISGKRLRFRGRNKSGTVKCCGVGERNQATSDRKMILIKLSVVKLYYPKYDIVC